MKNNYFLVRISYCWDISMPTLDIFFYLHLFNYNVTKQNALWVKCSYDSSKEQ